MQTRNPLARVLALAFVVIGAILVGAGARSTPPAAAAGGTGTGTASDGGLVIMPTPLDFGLVSVGTTAGSSLSVINTNSTLAVEITAPLGKPATTDCDAFNVTPVPALTDKVPAMTTRTWTVSFKPNNASFYDCSWDLTTDDGKKDTVHLTGTGVSGHLTATPNPTDFGSQPLGSTIDQGVTISNDGSGAVAVTAITETSGNPPFTIVNLPALPVTLQPTQSTSFTARFHPTAMGSFSGTVRVDDSDAASPSLMISLAGAGGGSGSGAVITLAPSPVDFGSVAVGSTGPAALAVGNTGSSTLSVTGMTITGAAAADFHFADASLGCTTGQTCAQPFSIAPASIPRTVALACTPSVGGLRLATLAVASNAIGGTSSVTLQCNGSAPGLTVSPGSISYGTIRVNTTAHANLTLGNNGTADLHVSSITFDGTNPGDFAASSCTAGCTIAPTTQTILDVTFTPPVRGVRTANLHVHSDDPARPDVVVALDGAGGLPVLVITQPSGKSIDFGGIPVSTTSSAVPVTVQNQGELTLNVLTAAAAPAQFAATGPTTPRGLAPSATATWNLTCRPDAATTFNGAFTVTSDDPATPSAQVTLACQGINSNIVANPSPVSFGEVRIGKTATTRVTFTNQGALGVTINSAPVMPSGGGFTDAVVGTLPRTLAQNDTLQVDVTFAPGADMHYAGTLQLVDNVGTTAASVALAGDGRLASYSVAPTMIDFGARCVGQSDSMDVVITNDGTAHVSLVSTAISGAGASAFTISSGNVTAEIDLAPTAKHTLSIVGVAAAGARAADLVVTTDVDGALTKSVSLAITGTQSGVVANPSTLGFGAQPIGVATSPMSVSVINCSAAPLTVRSVAVAGADATAFQVAGNQSTTIPVGADQAWTVVFTAAREGAHTAELDLHDDGATDPLVVALTGSGQGTGSGADAGVDNPNGVDTTSYYACACRAGASPSAGAPIMLAFALALRPRRKRRPRRPRRE